MIYCLPNGSVYCFEQNESRTAEVLAAATAVGVACTFAAPIGGKYKITVNARMRFPYRLHVALTLFIFRELIGALQGLRLRCESHSAIKMWHQPCSFFSE